MEDDAICVVLDRCRENLLHRSLERLIRNLGRTGETRLMVGLNLAHPLDRELIHLVRLDVMLVTQQDEIAPIATLIVRHGWVEALARRKRSLDVAHLADPLALVIDELPVAFGKRALVAGMN